MNTEEEKNEMLDEEVEVEVLEFALGEEDINELIEKLTELKDKKNPIEFDIDEENQLLINFEEELEDDEEEDLEEGEEENA